MTFPKVRRFAVAAAVLALPVIAVPALDGPAGAAPGDFLPQGSVGFTGLTLPYGVAVSPTGQVVATSYPDDTATVGGVLRLAGTVQTTVATGDVGSPFGVALDTTGNTYVTDASAGTVIKVPAGGGAATTLPFTGLSFPTGVAVASDGDVYVADSGNARVVKLEGTTQSTVGFSDLVAPYGVAVDSTGAVLVADLEADAVRKLVGSTQTTVAFTGLESPQGIAVDADDDVIVSDAGNDRVVEVPAAGGTQTVLPFTGLGTPAGVAVDAQGGIYVADTDNNRIATLLVEQAPARTANQSLAYAAYNDFIDRDPTPSELTSAVAALGGTTDATPAQRAAFMSGLANSDVYLGAVVNKLYQDTLGRNGDPGGVAFWTNKLRLKSQTVAQVAATFYSSNEYFAGFGDNDLETWVKDLYVKVLLRTGDPGGVQFYVNRATNQGRYAVAFPIYQSPESSRTRVKGLFQFLLGRQPDAAGLDFWDGRVLTQGDVALAVNLAGSGEYKNKAIVRFP